MTTALFRWAANDPPVEEHLSSPSPDHVYLPLAGYDAIVLQLRLASYADKHPIHPFDRRCINRVRATRAVHHHALPAADVYLRLAASEAKSLERILEDFVYDRPLHTFDVSLVRELATRWFCCAECHAEHQGSCAGSVPNVPVGTPLALPL